MLLRERWRAMMKLTSSTDTYRSFPSSSPGSSTPGPALSAPSTSRTCRPSSAIPSALPSPSLLFSYSPPPTRKQDQHDTGPQEVSLRRREGALPFGQAGEQPLRRLGRSTARLLHLPLPLPQGGGTEELEWRDGRRGVGHCARSKVGRRSEERTRAMAMTNVLVAATGTPSPRALSSMLRCVVASSHYNYSRTKLTSYSLCSRSAQPSRESRPMSGVSCSSLCRRWETTSRDGARRMLVSGGGSSLHAFFEC